MLKKCFFLLFALLMLTVSAQADVLVAARVQDVYDVAEHITSDTQVLVLADCTSKEANALAKFLKEQQAPAAIRLGFKSMNQYTEANLDRYWTASGAHYAKLIASLRTLQDDSVAWYADPSTPALHDAMGELLLKACQAAEDPTVRGSEKTQQYTFTIQTLTDLSNGQVTPVGDNGWRTALQTFWGAAELPVIEGAPTLNEEGFWDGEPFIYRNAEQGVWYYVSNDLRITITKHQLKTRIRYTWYEADVVRRAGGDEWLRCVSDPKHPKEQIDPTGIAKDWVLAINSDYYQFRRNKKGGTGLIIRGGKLMYGKNLGKAGSNVMPTLDCMLLTRDGGMTMHPATTLTADAALAQDAWDVLSFGPILAKNGGANQLIIKNREIREPRTAVGLLGDNHYLLVFVEGRLRESAGMSLDELQQLMLARGATDAINLDGGRTSCMYFMGEQLGSVGNGKTSITPRIQWELLAIGDNKN